MHTVPLTIHVIQREGGPPVVLGDVSEFDAFIKSRRGEIAVHEREIASAETEITLADAATDIESAERERRISKARSAITDARRSIHAAKTAIAETERLKPELERLRSMAEAKTFEIEVPSWDEVSRVEAAYTKMVGNGEGFVVDRGQVVTALTRTACRAAVTSHPVIGRRIYQEVARHVYGESSDLPFLLGLLTPS